MQFTAPWSDSLRLMTGAGSAIVVLAITISTLKRQPWLRIAAMCAVAGFLLVSWGFAPGGYTVDAARVTVLRPFGNVAVERASVTAVRGFEDADSAGLMRTAGNGGLFGYYGWYKSDRLGSHKWYVTDRERMVLVETRDGALVMSPGDPARFIEAAKPSK